MKTQKIGFIGCGNMASAIISGMINADKNIVTDINIYDVDASKCKRFCDLGTTLLNNAEDLVKMSDTVFICVKPQVISEALSSLTDNKGKLFISIAAGISTSFLATLLGNETKIIRVMPNTPLLLGEGATAVCANANVDKCELDIAIAIFEKLGVVEEIPESLMNEIIALNGSMPAMVYYFIDSAIKSAVSQGINEVKAKNLICASFVGSAKMLYNSEMSPDELIRIVCSPGGTTERMVSVLKDSGTDKIIHESMVKCTERAYQLEK